MSMPDPGSKPWWDDLVESYVDGTLSEEDAARLEELRSSDALLEEHLAIAESMKDTFHRLSGVECPDSVIKGVMTEVRADIVSNAASRVSSAVAEFVSRQLRPALAMLTLLTVVVLASRIGDPTPVENPAVAEALGDVKWTLAYLSQVSRQTGTAVRSEALEPLVLNSMQHAVDAFIDN